MAILRLLKRHTAIVNALLTFASAVFAGLWVNYLSSGQPMTDREHALLPVAVLLVGAQCWFIYSTSRPERRVIRELLDLGVRFFIAHARPGIGAAEVRAFVHLCEKMRPGRTLAKQRCLMPRYWSSPGAVRDFGAIPLDAESFRKWYVNVLAFHEQQTLCREPDLVARPSDDGLDVRVHFSARSVISTPVWSRATPPAVIGTLTFDSARSLAEMNWQDATAVNAAAQDMLHALADLIGKILSNEEDAA
ncbi:MAG TPA: hypothetical protein VGI48_11215 [Caldimonas sp.]|jgi:hypothetical protein